MELWRFYWYRNFLFNNIWYLLHKKMVEAYLYFPGKLLSILSVKLSTNIGESDFPLHNLLSTTRWQIGRHRLAQFCPNKWLLVAQTLEQTGPLSLVEDCRGCALIGWIMVLLTPALLCHKDTAQGTSATSWISDLISDLEWTSLPWRRVHKFVALFWFSAMCLLKTWSKQIKQI